MRLVLIATALAALVAGCSVGPNYVTPQLPVPDAFAATDSAAEPGRAVSEAPGQWWHMLDDAELNSLVGRAILANLDIAVALSRVQAAREREVVAFGTALPRLAVAGGTAEGSGTETVKGRIPSSLDAGTNGRGLTEITSVAGFD